ncbi:MAG: RluA family pseudouridine synthase, partial [Planctomycetia bacterium]
DGPPRPRILREGSGVVAVWKPAGLATQAPPGIPSVEAWLRARLHGDRGGYLGVPHRLDRAVSGVLVLAATPRAARQLSRQFERRQVRKTYLAVVAADGAAGTAHTLCDWSVSADGAATVWHDRIEKVPDQPRTRIVPPETPGGREALTTARLLRALPEGRLLLEFEPLTGRMHQLRLQSSARGLPILGDTLYGGPTPAGQPGSRTEVDPRERAIALHAVRIEYTDPETAQRVAVEAPLPAWWPAPKA